jgi:transcriptional regulator with XRE-family HTH domain
VRKNYDELVSQARLILDFQSLAKALLEQQGMTQAQLAERCGMTVQQVNKLVTNASANPCLTTMAKVFHHLGYQVGLKVHKAGPKRRYYCTVCTRIAGKERYHRHGVACPVRVQTAAD